MWKPKEIVNGIVQLAEIAAGVYLTVEGWWGVALIIVFFVFSATED